MANRERIPLLGSAFRAPRPRLAGCGDLRRAGLHAQGRELETCGTKRGVGAERGEPRGREAEKAYGSPRQSLCHAEESLGGLPLGLISAPLLHRRSSAPLAPRTYLLTSERLRSGFSLALLCLQRLVFLQEEN